MGALAAIGALVAIVVVVVSIGGTVVQMRLMPGVSAALVVPEGHALPRCQRGHPLRRNGEHQQQDGPKAEACSKHRRTL